MNLLFVQHENLLTIYLNYSFAKQGKNYAISLKMKMCDKKKNSRTSVREFYQLYLRFGGLWIASPSTSAKASYMFSEKVG